MRILLSLSCTNPDVDGASYGLVELSPEWARDLIALHTRGRAFLAELAKDNLVSEFSCPSFNVYRHAFSAYRYTEQLGEMLRGEDRLLVLDPAVDLEVNEEEECVECFEISLRENSVQFSAMAKHGDYGYTAEDISLDILRAVAGGAEVLTTEKNR